MLTQLRRESIRPINSEWSRHRAFIRCRLSDGTKPLTLPIETNGSGPERTSPFCRLSAFASTTDGALPRVREKQKMSSETSVAGAADSRSTFEQTTVIAILAALSLSHLLNDVMQSLLPAVYPLLKAKYSLSFFQIGLITFSFQV